MVLKVLLLLNRVPYPLHDGGALAMDAMIQGYHLARQQVYVLAMNTTRHPVPGDTLSKLYRNIAGFYTVEHDNTISGRKIVRNLIFSREPEHAERFSSGMYAARLQGLLEDIQPDIVQLESPFLAGYLDLIRTHSKALIVYRMHNIESQIWNRLASGAKGLRQRYLKILSQRVERYEHSLWKNAQLLLPITDADAAVVRSAGIHTPMEICPFGIQLSTYEEQFPPEPFRLFHIGAMDWMPNVEAIEWFLKEVWPDIHQKIPELSFYFAGRSMPESLGMNLPEGCYCSGEVSDAREFIHNKHILVVPLRSGSGIRIKILEALNDGKLVISTDIGMQGIQLEDQKHYLRANSAEDFITVIHQVALNPEWAESMASSGQHYLREHYNSTTIMEQLLHRIQQFQTS